MELSPIDRDRLRFAKGEKEGFFSCSSFACHIFRSLTDSPKDNIEEILLFKEKSIYAFRKRLQNHVHCLQVRWSCANTPLHHYHHHQEREQCKMINHTHHIWTNPTFHIWHSMHTSLSVISHLRDKAGAIGLLWVQERRVCRQRVDEVTKDERKRKRGQPSYTSLLCFICPRDEQKKKSTEKAFVQKQGTLLAAKDTKTNKNSARSALEIIRRPIIWGRAGIAVNIIELEWEPAFFESQK